LFKNLPLLIFILIIGVSTFTISTNEHLPTFLEWTLPIISIIFNATAVVGLSLHKPMKQAEDNLNEVIR
jgi:predicted benzoate:H+ symporter BenE